MGFLSIQTQWKHKLRNLLEKFVHLPHQRESETTYGCRLVKAATSNLIRFSSSFLIQIQPKSFEISGNCDETGDGYFEERIRFPNWGCLLSKERNNWHIHEKNIQIRVAFIVRKPKGPAKLAVICRRGSLLSATSDATHPIY